MQRLEQYAAVGLLFAILTAVPTITPNRRIVVTTRPVVVDMIIVTEQRGAGPVKATVTPASQRKNK
jgi:hypothetical protein